MNRSRSRRFVTVLLSGLVTLATGVTFASAASARAHPAQDPVPIKPNQYFSGFINGHPPGKAVIKVLCPGPGQTGHPIANQPIVVKPAPASSAADVGFTGSAGMKIKALLPRATITSILATFTNYFVAQNIPTGITVPCSGTGSVIFAPAPGSTTARPATLAVTFLNIGT
jgi:hypothetical protein